MIPGDLCIKGIGQEQQMWREWHADHHLAIVSQTAFRLQLLVLQLQAAVVYGAAGSKFPLLQLKQRTSGLLTVRMSGVSGAPLDNAFWDLPPLLSCGTNLDVQSAARFWRHFH